jgi:glutamine synthetase
MYTEGHLAQDAVQLPLNLLDAVRAFDGDAGLKAMMGEGFAAAYSKLKMQEWQSFLAHFSTWEKANTLDI